MLLCDHIVFWARNNAMPEVTDEDLQKFLGFLEKRTRWLCQRATARMLGRLKK